MLVLPTVIFTALVNLLAPVAAHVLVFLMSIARVVSIHAIIVLVGYSLFALESLIDGTQHVTEYT